MYTIVMDKYKNLNTTVRAVLYQQENMADQIQFLLPPTYEGNNLSEYIVTLKYIDPNGNFHSEILTVDEEKYKEYLRYTLPVTTNFTKVSGNITIRLTLVKFDQQDTTLEIDKLETNSTVVRINRPMGFVDNVNFEDIEAWKVQMTQMNSDINNLQDNMPNDLAVDDKDVLKLTHDETPIGNGVEIIVRSVPDEDGIDDGVIEADDIADKTSQDDDLEFIEADDEINTNPIDDDF